MTRHILYFLLISLTIACSKKSSDPQPADQPTVITINVKDEVGNPVPYSSIKIYTNQTDFNNDSAITSYPNTTDGNGTYSTTASAVTYYWRIKNDCQSNIFKANHSAAPLTANQTNVFTAVIGKIANINLTNTSINPYYVYLDGILTLTMNGGTSKSIIVPIGTHSVRVLQKSGYLVSPTDKTYTAAVGCHMNYSVTFP